MANARLAVGNELSGGGPRADTGRAERDRGQTDTHMASQETSREAGAKPGSGSGVGKAAPGTGRPAGETAKSEEPDWSHGLRQLYDSVVEEDLPESFKALLDKLDQIDPDGPGHAGDTSDSSPTTGGGA